MRAFVVAALLCAGGLLPAPAIRRGSGPPLCGGFSCLPFFGGTGEEPPSSPLAPTAPRHRTQNTSRAPKPIVAIFADYDGCFDVYAAKNNRHYKKTLKVEEQRYKFADAAKLLDKYLKGITTNAHVILFSGSARQSARIERIGIKWYKTGNSQDELGKLAARKKWTFNNTLLDTRWFDENMGLSENVYNKKIKKDLVENNLKALLKIIENYPLENPTTVYFFDDQTKYLDYVMQEVKSGAIWVPDRITFHTVEFHHLNMVRAERKKRLRIRETRERQDGL